MEHRIRKKIIEEMDLSRDISDEEIISIIRQEICLAAKENPISITKRKILEHNIFNSLRKLDVLQELLEDEEITEILINGYQKIFIEKQGRLIETDKVFSSKEKLDDVIQQMVAINNKVVNETTPIVDTRLEDGSRVNIVLPPVSVEGSIISIRKFPKERMTMERLIELKSLSVEVSEFLQKLVKAKYNIFISGGTGSGKTTFLNALSQYVSQEDRVITIEDSAELQLQGVENLVRLEARNPNLEGKLEITIRDLVRCSLRMRPDRIIVGECRGKEALEVLQAANTGHDGTMSTGHANSPQDMLSRLETMVLMSGMELPISAIRKQIASGIDVFVHLARLPDKSRKVVTISEVIGIDKEEIQMRPLYEYVNTGGKSEWKQINQLYHRKKLEMAGFVQELTIKDTD